MDAVSNSKKVFAVILVLCALSGIAAGHGGLVVSQSLSSTGNITTPPGLSVFSDSTCTQVQTHLDWDPLIPGASVSHTIYILNTGSTPMVLSFAAQNWIPANASSYLMLSWSLPANTVLAAGKSVAATLTLMAAPNISGMQTFSVGIVILGTTP